MQIQIFSFFLGTRMILATHSGCCSSLTKSESISFLTSDLIASMISRRSCCYCCLSGLASRLMLRRCIAIWGSSRGMSSQFQTKTSIYSRMSYIRSSFSEDDKLSLMKMDLRLTSSPRFIWITLSWVGGQYRSRSQEEWKDLDLHRLLWSECHFP